jgi:hypothetical protein
MQNCEHGSAAPTVVLEGLPASQAGAARHKCVVCAFQRGQQGAIAAGAVERCGHGHSAPIEVLRALPDSQAGPGLTRHRCAVCAYAAGADAALGAWTYPEVAPSSGMFPEGAQTVVTVNAYERSAAARAACIAHHGANCSACGMNFEQTYGPVGKGFIHVHHLKALASIGIEYNVDPVADLRPICPNCHAMLHRGEPMHSIEDLRTMLQSAQKSGPSQSR